MFGRPHATVLRCAAALLLLGTIVGWAGCGSPRERYRTLSFFFDGVPDPDAPKVVRTAAATGPAVAAHPIISRHKPYVENKCDLCHRFECGGDSGFRGGL